MCHSTSGSPEQVKLADDAASRSECDLSRMSRRRLAESATGIGVPRRGSWRPRLPTRMNGPDTSAPTATSSISFIGANGPSLSKSPTCFERAKLHIAALREFRDEANPVRCQRTLRRELRLVGASVSKIRPEIPVDSATGSDVMMMIEKYVDVLRQLELSLEDEELADAFFRYGSLSKKMIH